MLDVPVGFCFSNKRAVLNIIIAMSFQNMSSKTVCIFLCFKFSNSYLQDIPHFFM
jgi:hypothetical protein